MMESKNLGYSIKNIPLSNKDVYLKSLIQKTEDFVRRLRWKVFHYLKQNDDVQINTFGFKSLATPPKNQLLYEFENDIYNMVKNVEFKKVNNSFQEKIMSDIKSIKKSEKVFVHADKTTNMYGVMPEEYEKLLSDNVTKTYKKSNRTQVETVNKEAFKITEKLNLLDKVQVLNESPAFITIKDHKPNFPNKISCRLLNPCKSNIGKISKNHLETINNEIRKAKQSNQWKNTSSVIEWFKGINSKSTSHFIKFDIVSFYPSITLDLLSKSIEFAKQYYTITDDIVEAIMNTRKSFLFFKGEPWVKKDNNGQFDVAEGSFDGAEVCELVGLFLLSKLEPLFTNGSVGLYRDDGLAFVNKYSGPQQDKLRKEIIGVFKNENLQITIDIKLKVIDFLDIKLDLINNKFYPYRKPNDTPMYVNIESNHPSIILKQIPKMTSLRLSNLSSDENEFNKAAEIYQHDLQKSGYKDKLQYCPNVVAKRQRKRKVLWYNPPFDKQVKSNVAKQFLGLIDKHFPPHHRLHKILNRNCVKVSYSCMPNIASYIAAHNICEMEKYHSSKSAAPPKCNCKEKPSCPLNGECLTRAIVYQATCNNAENQKYIGVSEPTFKGRYRDHVCSMNNKRYANKTELSKFYWEQKEDNGREVTFAFSILRRTIPYRAGAKYCNLCLWEKVLIMKGDNSLLNERDEFINKCRHVNKFLMKNFKSKFK